MHEESDPPIVGRWGWCADKLSQEGCIEAKASELVQNMCDKATVTAVVQLHKMQSPYTGDKAAASMHAADWSMQKARRTSIKVNAPETEEVSSGMQSAEITTVPVGGRAAEQSVETAVWLNTLLRKMWPFVNTFAETLCRTTVQEAIQAAVPSVLNGIHFETVSLGDEAVRFGNFEVVPVESDEVRLLIDVIFDGTTNELLQARRPC